MFLTRSWPGICCMWSRQRIRGVTMKVLSTEKSKLLAELNGWSLAFAQGYVEGETSRRLGKTPSLHVLVGIDETSMGFRAGYFERQSNDSTRGKAEVPVRRPGQARVG